jgi:hypothetical protein
MPKKRRKKYTMTDEQKEGARQRMLLIHERRKLRATLNLPIHSVLERVYMAGWKHNKFQVIKEANQMSIAQADTEINRLIDEVFNTKTE